MARRLIIIILLATILLPCTAQQMQLKPIDEIRTDLKKSTTDTGKANQLLNLALCYVYKPPLGLILNEAIANAVKYAYPENQKGDINISLQYTGAEQLQLKIADHGKGLPADMDAGNSNSLGLQLIKLFAEQMEGDLFFLNNNGLEILLNFKITAYTNAMPLRAMA